MIFSLFETQKTKHKVQLKNPNKVVIGSHTDIEMEFQIGNFMNMLYLNFENESQTMTNSTIKHNLMIEVDLLIKHCINNSNDGCSTPIIISKSILWLNHLLKN